MSVLSNLRPGRRACGSSIVVALLFVATASAQAASWASLDSMSSPRSNHTATLLADGRVLVAGGYTDSHLSATASAELFDPVTGTWSSAPDMSAARANHTATLLQDGRVLVMGGGGSGDGGFHIARTAEIYDPASNSWSSGGTMVVGRVGHTASLLSDGRVLVA